MVLVFADSFDHYTTAQALRKWTTAGAHSIGAGGRFGSGAILAGGGGGSSRKTCTNASGDTIIVGFAYKPGAFATGDRLFYIGIGGVAQATITVTPTGRVTVLLGAGAVLVTSSVALSVGVWSYIECKIKLANAGGTVELRIDGATVGTFAGDTQAAATATWDEIGWGQTAVACAAGTIDDLVVCDGSGAVNNSFVGDCRVEALYPTGAGTTTAWTPSAGANWSTVDENPATDDTDYNASSTATQVDTFAASDLTPAAGTVVGVQYVIQARKDDAGSRTVRPVVRTAGADYEVGADLAVPSSYGMLLTPQDVNPATGVAWSIAGVNGAEIGYILKA